MIRTLSRTLGLALLTAVVVHITPSAQAGDFDNQAPPYRGSTKDDGYPIPQPPPPDYRQGSYKDDPLPPPPPPRRVAECLSKYGIRNALNQQGWHEFENVEIRGDTARMLARNDGGRRFDLRFDTCTGQVLDSHPHVVYVDEPPPVIDHYYYAPRPAVGFYFGGGGGYGHHHWR